MAIPTANAGTIAARRQALAVLADSPDGCTRAEMFRRGLGPAVLNDLLLKRLAIAHMATEVRGGMPAASAPNCERAHLPAHAFTVFADETDGKGTEFGL